MLWASRLESGTLHVSIEQLRPASSCARRRRGRARRTCRANVELELARADGVPLRRGRSRQGAPGARRTSSTTRSSTRRTAAASRSARAAGRSVRFTVRDEGLGIPAAEHERVFEKFYRLDPNLTRGVGGTGLGLYICRELVRRMDGRIWRRVRERRRRLASPSSSHASRNTPRAAGGRPGASRSRAAARRRRTSAAPTRPPARPTTTRRRSRARSRAIPTIIRIQPTTLRSTPETSR